jgi:polar amino acid transport system permease protein
MSGHLSALAHGVGQTMTITLGALAIGLVLAFPVAVMRRSRRAVLRLPATGFIELFRSVPPIVWLFFIYYGLAQEGFRASTYQAAVLGLGLIATAYLAEIYRAGLDAVGRTQWEAAEALGLPALARYRWVILPQALVVVIPPAATYGIGLLKDSAIASVIGAREITFFAFQQTQASLEGLTIFTAAGLLYIASSIPLAGLARFADHRLASRLTR